MRSARAPVLAGALLLFAAAPASASGSAAGQPVTIQFASFSPTPVDVLPGDTVRWSNTSTRAHTVTSDDRLFDSGTVLSGEHFTWTFDSLGTFAYHCALHPGMVGEVDVRAVTLGPLPTAALVPGAQVRFAGRTADPSAPVRVQRRDGSSGFSTVATVTPSASGAWHASMRVRRTGDFRALVAGGASEMRRLRVSERRVRVRASRSGRVRVKVTPADPYGRIMLQLRLREHFGWWTVARKRLDYVSQATFRVRRRTPVRVRAVLVDKDRWSPLATSRVVVVGDRGGHRGGDHRGRGGGGDGGGMGGHHGGGMHMSTARAGA